MSALDRMSHAPNCGYRGDCDCGLSDAQAEMYALRKRCEDAEKAIEAAYIEGWDDGNREGESSGQSLGFRMGRASASSGWEHSEVRKALRGGV